MIQKYLIALAICCFVPRLLVAADYLVQLESVKFEFVPGSDKIAETKSLGTVEVLCRPGERAQARATIAKETLALNVSIRSVTGNAVSMDVDYRRAEYKAKTAPNQNGAPSEIPNATMMRSPVTLVLDQRLEKMGLVTNDAAGRFQEGFVLTVKEYKPFVD